MALLPLFGLALIDSTSFGTLVIPLALVIRRRAVDTGPLAVYFATVCGFYFLLGIGLLFGLDRFRQPLSDLINSDPAVWGQLVLGAALLAYGVLADTPKRRDVDSIRQPAGMSARGMFGLGMGAAAIEAATMVPYLAAIAIISGAGWPVPVRLGALALYCLVMILPALVLIAVAAVFGQRIWPRLTRLIGWLEHETRVTILWIAAIVGFYMVADAVTRLGLVGG